MLTLRVPLLLLPSMRKQTKDALEHLGIQMIEDLLYHIPSRYIDFSAFSSIVDVQIGETVSVIGNVISMKNIFTRHGTKIQTAVISDKTGSMEAVWFNQMYLTRVILPRMKVALAGKIALFNKKKVLESPEYEVISSFDHLPSETENDRLIHTGRLAPVYPVTAGITPRTMRNHIFKLLHNPTIIIKDPIPQEIKERYQLIDEANAVHQIHFPESLDQIKISRNRLAFDELFYIQINTEFKRREREKETTPFAFKLESHLPYITDFINKLPFTLTGSQQKAINEIFSDLKNSYPMNRILVGDVGSGKTIIALIASLLTHLNGYQTMLMAPTEILATQHFHTFQQLLPKKIKIKLVTGTQKPKGNAHIWIGTHALLTTKLELQKIGIIIIDEQQRFGVEQRAKLIKFSTNPNLLTMTATPIPRTVALSLFGDLDVSFLTEQPKNRITIKTWVVPSAKREAAYRWMTTQITSSPINGKKDRRSQAFIICPFIEESESLQTVKAAKNEFKRLQSTYFSNLRLGILHGRMKSDEKNKVLTDFKKGEYDILVATPVVEVGIDIPTATIILIEGSDRFGLAQLHQLRGRVGRSDRASYCLLFTESESPEVMKRLKLLETINNGPLLAEADLKLRGPGELFGTRQHGSWGLKIAKFSDFTLIRETREAAHWITDEQNAWLINPYLRDKLKKYTIRVSSSE